LTALSLTNFNPRSPRGERHIEAAKNMRIK